MSKHYLNETKSAYPNVCYSKQGGLNASTLLGGTSLFAHTYWSTPMSTHLEVKRVMGIYLNKTKYVNREN